ncbi:hypothetical protein BOS5A_210675 [Bosea sp. EC-HK365B]|nr:hypothetical protein BOSE7B_120537 [Bosea sp. 7B]CAD5276394.1 hypothetical protein BOSE21B_30375 [Bosea sp. 21B]VVT59884.1 hypothetical protein BOS5A_210675 [Bosea sp. EC-HK365B]
MWVVDLHQLASIFRMRFYDAGHPPSRVPFISLGERPAPCCRPLGLRKQLNRRPEGLRRCRGLLGDFLAGAAERRREVLQLGQAVPHRQHGLGVVDVDAGGKGQRRDRRGEDVDESQGRMVRHQMPAAFRTVLTLAQRGLLEGRDMLGPGCDPHRLGLPQGKRVHRTAGPRAAGAAMAIAHRLRFAADLKFDCAAKAFSKVRHGVPFSTD